MKRYLEREKTRLDHVWEICKAYGSGLARRGVRGPGWGGAGRVLHMRHLPGPRPRLRSVPALREPGGQPAAARAEGPGTV
ncbi:hypothetical protein GCM10029978_074590 [Actinoallomurus acanthiterrae]